VHRARRPDRRRPPPLLRDDATPLQRRIAFVVRLVIALTVLMSGAILAQACGCPKLSAGS
jgi:hypothetical protein